MLNNQEEITIPKINIQFNKTEVKAEVFKLGPIALIEKYEPNIGDIVKYFKINNTWYLKIKEGKSFIHKKILINDKKQLCISKVISKAKFNQVNITYKRLFSIERFSVRTTYSFYNRELAATQLTDSLIETLNS